MDKNNQKWRDKLTDFEYKVCREKGTEQPFSGKYDKFYEDGEYFCKCCNEKLFDSKAKFDSGSGWPSFYEGIENKIEYIKDKSLFMERTEIVCKKCGSHLGHVFDDAYQTPTGNRYCVNSVSLKFDKRK